MLQVRETTRDVAILHNEQFFAAAQKKYVYIYDKRGLEVHCLKVGPNPGLSESQLSALSPRRRQHQSLVRGFMALQK